MNIKVSRETDENELVTCVYTVILRTFPNLS